MTDISSFAEKWPYSGGPILDPEGVLYVTQSVSGGAASKTCNQYNVSVEGTTVGTHSFTGTAHSVMVYNTGTTDLQVGVVGGTFLNIRSLGNSADFFAPPSAYTNAAGWTKLYHRQLTNEGTITIDLVSWE